MDPNNPKRLPTLGDRAAELLDGARALEGEARARYLSDACGSDESLREELLSLIHALEGAGEFLELSSPSADAPSRDFTPEGGIDRYELVELIGEGGFGVVYRAEQLEPVRRQVAVKVIKLGMDTRQVIARFEAERQALAVMDHPHIAKVFDAGATRSGRPYFAMELVSGAPVTQFCDAQRLDTRERLRLFIQICHAIQHAHQKGIIHRDIKPSNVLVSVIDGVASPKVIDFGIAKATQAELTARTILTEQRQMIGTPAYMSPEQVALEDYDIDTRSDIYSLGVLLYELLTSTTPHDSTKLLRAGPSEMLRILREEEPARPSTRLSALGEARTEVATRRGTDVRHLRTALRGDLDWIVMKCLEKDRSRRYSSAVALAEDVERHLRDEPVLASAPSAVYRMSKFVRRHRAAVAATALILIVLISASAISLRFAWKETQARKLAETRAEETKQVADFQANMLSGLNAEAVGRGIRSQMRETLRAALERQPVGEWPNRRQRTTEEIEAELSTLDSAIGPIPAADVARRVLDEFLLGQASKTVEQSFADQPLVEARIRDSLCSAYSALGLKPQAEEQCRMALAIRRKELASLDADTANTLTSLATILGESGRYSEAESLSREVLEIRLRIYNEKHVEVAWAFQNLASMLRRQGKLGEAERHYRQALAIRRELLGDEHLDTAGSLNSLALLLQNSGDYAGAEPLFRESLAIRRRLLGERHIVLAGSLNNLGNLLAYRGNRTEAESLLREALAMRRELLGAEHAEVAQGLHNLGLFLNDDMRYADAELLLREAVEIWRRTLPPGHPDLGRAIQGLALVVKAQKKYADAEPLFRESLKIARESLPEGDSGVAFAMLGWASLLCDRGDFEQCESLYRDIISQYETRLPPEQRQVGRLNLAAALIKRTAALADVQGAGASRLAEAETILLAVNAAFSTSKNASPGPVQVQRCLESLVELYELRHANEPDKGFEAKAAEYRDRLVKLNSSASHNR